MSGPGGTAGGPGIGWRAARHIPVVPRASSPRRALAGAAGALLLAVGGCNEDAAGPGGRQANAIWVRDFAPAARALVVAGGPGAVAIAAGDSLRVLDNAIGTPLWSAPWRDTLANGTMTGAVLVAPVARGAVVFDRVTGARLATDTSDAPGAPAIVGTAVVDSIVVLQRADGQLRAFVARTGRALWRGAAQCGATPCAMPRLVALRGGVVATGRLADNSGSYLLSVDALTGSARPTGFPARTTFVANIAVVDTSDLVIMNQSADSLFVMRGATGERLWGRTLFLQGAAPTLVGDVSPIAIAGAVLSNNRAGNASVATVHERGDGTPRWRRDAFVAVGACGARILAADPDGFRLYEPATGAVYLRLAPFRPAVDTTGTPRRPVTAGDIAVVFTSPRAVRVYAC